MMAVLLFARAGVCTTVLEKHGDFLRDFRGDTVHPSTLRLFSEMGLLGRFLERPHNKVHGIGAFMGDRQIEVADFSHFDPRWNFTALMPRWDLLDFVADEARGEPIDMLLPSVRKRRPLQIRTIQGFQKPAQDRIITPLLSSSTAFKPPLPLRLLARYPVMRRIHVRSPVAKKSKS